MFEVIEFRGPRHIEIRAQCETLGEAIELRAALTGEHDGDAYLRIFDCEQQIYIHPDAEAECCRQHSAQ